MIISNWCAGAFAGLKLYGTSATKANISLVWMVGPVVQDPIYSFLIWILTFLQRWIFKSSGNLPSVISKYFLCYHRFDISHWREVLFPSTEPTLFVEYSLFRNLDLNNCQRLQHLIISVHSILSTTAIFPCMITHFQVL